MTYQGGGCFLHPVVMDRLSEKIWQKSISETAEVNTIFGLYLVQLFRCLLHSFAKIQLKETNYGKYV